MNEFEMIADYFAPLSPDGLTDDAAVLKIPAGQELVVTTDTLNEGVHFHADQGAGDIARRALRVNLSDLAAMGADPYAYQLSLALPGEPEEEWIRAFTAALAEDQETYAIFCSGGDTTTSKGPLSISITAMGVVPAGKAVYRSGAREGDAVILTGPVGEAMIRDYRHVPKPRTDLIPLIREYAHAAIDISDGLVADLDHICSASGLMAEIDIQSIPFPDAAIPHEDLLSGGDDYELLLAVAPENIGHFDAMSTIGVFRKGHGVNIQTAGHERLKVSNSGWWHF